MTNEELKARFPRLIPIKSSPPLFRINGCGLGMYGSRDRDPETNAYVATLCLSLLFIPVLAIRAYRVAKAGTGGWYFLGREPMSGLAKSWNVLLLLGAIGTFGVFQYEAYTSTPAYKAERRMAAAKKFVEGGKLTDGAKIYQSLALAGADQADNATTAFKALLDNQCKTAPLNESAGVYALATQMARRGSTLVSSEVSDKAFALVADRGESDPPNGLAVLDAVRPLVIDTRPLDAKRLPLLRKWVAVDPKNLEAVVPLASVLEEQGNRDDAKKLLMPLKASLRDGEGARVLGMILGHDGDLDGAYALLWPYVSTRLDRLHATEKTADDTANRLWEHQVDLLKNEKAPHEFYEKYENASKDQQRAMVKEYISAKIKNDPEYVRTQEALEHETAAVPAAMELGIVMVERAQGLQDPATRKSQFEAAEKVFLAIGGFAGETDEYRLSLGQVDYWLGKPGDGHKLFDEYLTSKGRAFKYLLQIASKLRQVGAVPEARTMAEEAYNKGSNPEEQHAAAEFRSVCFHDTDDKIVWLQKSDLAEPMTKAALAKSLGDKAFEEGRDEEAARQYRAALDVYATLPRSSGVLNETALVYFSIFNSVGDRAMLDRCVDFFQQAVDLEPTDSVLQSNAGVTLMNGALADVIGQQIDLRALRDVGDTRLLAYLYRDQAGRAVIAKRVREHPGVARAMSFLERVTVLSPKNSSAFAEVYDIHHFTRNEPAMRALEQRLKSAELDTTDRLARMKEFISGAKDEQRRTVIEASLKRSQSIADTLRPKGGITAAVALDEYATQIVAMDMYGGAADLDKAVALAEEADKLAPSAGTSSTLSATRLSRAAKQLRNADPAFASFFKQYGRSVSTVMLMTLAAKKQSPYRDLVLKNPDVQKAVADAREVGTLFPDNRSAYEWALLTVADPPAAELAADSICKTPRKVLEQSISVLLNPTSAEEAIETCWLMQILGKPEEGRAALGRVAAAGIPVPIQP